MTQTTFSNDDTNCSAFLDRLDAWLAGELEAEGMWEHHDSCESCRLQARLAREIGGIMTALPELRSPEIRTPAGKVAPRGPTLAQQLLSAWRQPLVFVPAMAALVLALMLVPQLRVGDTAIEPELVVIDGEVYTRDEIQKATADLELALRYIDKYRPARVISAELDKDQPEAAPQDSGEQKRRDEAPTI